MEDSLASAAADSGLDEALELGIGEDARIQKEPFESFRPLKAESDYWRGLTPRQIRYVQLYFETKGNRAEALRGSGYSPGVSAHSVENTQGVSEYMAFKRSQMMQYAGVTEGSILANLQNVFELAVQNGDLKAAVNALKEQASILGIANKKEPPKSFDKDGKPIVIAAAKPEEVIEAEYYETDDIKSILEQNGRQ